MTMTAEDVKAALRHQFPPAEYLHLYEVPQTSDRQGRKIDLLLVTLWQSRGLARHAIEIKVSYQDWKRELENPAKADWWYHHSHQFSVCVPASLVERIMPELPPTWGLLSAISPTRVHTAVKAPLNRDPEPFTWAQTVGVLRAAVGTSTAMLAHEYERGRQRGASEASKGKVSAVDAQIEADAKRYRELLAKVRTFEAATGVSIAWNPGEAAEDFSRAVRFVRQVNTGRQVILSELRRASDRLSVVADSLESWDPLHTDIAPPSV